MKPFRNEGPNEFVGQAVVSGEREFQERRRALRDVTVAEAAAAAAKARRAAADWSAVPPSDRAALLLKTAEILRHEKPKLTAAVLIEVHKNWREADADVSEAIDFLEYYAREALRIAEERMRASTASEGLPMKPLGVVAVIAPWNFPLAILTGMTSAALVTGNSVLMKPAEQSPVIAARLFEILREAGVPEGVVQFLPGPGETIGDLLVRSADVDLVCFTGSKEVGMSIAAKKKRAIAEMGGKNAIIVDESADVDRAVEGALLSSFGCQGQKCSACSRILLLPAVYEPFKKRFVEAVSKIKIGDPKDPENFMGPVIDQEAEAKVRNYIEIGKTEARLLFQGSAPAEPGYVPPTIFDDIPPSARIANEEIFGPVVALMRAKDLAQALEIANSVPYDLTGGLFSNVPAHIERVKGEFEVGNLYINRRITGALVACQPFGGYRVSSLGFKAGGPEYLYQFLDSPPMPEPPARRELPRIVTDERNELVYTREGSRLLGKTICEKILN
jgi:RHH-type transcriptional regulator, proline utilization regulon repressor / proline dehydrogenase / delta 1-pyrroline-5-carboxylate dehydrogenase